jgi:tetratricopeptide (TPR) repeat protein
MKWINYCISMSPSSGIRATGYWQKAFYSYFLGNLDQTLNTLDTVEDLIEPIEWEFGRGSVDWFRAWVYYDMKKYELSRNYHKTAHAYDYQQAWKYSFNFSLGLIDLKQEKFDLVRSRLTTIKSLLSDAEPEDKDDAIFLHDLLYAELLFVQDSLRKAISVFENTSKLIKLDESPGELMGFYNIRYNRDIVARAYYKKGEIDRAILEYERLTSPEPNKRGRLLIHPLWRYELAKLYEEKGSKVKAIEQYEKFLEIWKDADENLPEPIDAKNRLAKLKASSKLSDI